MASSARIDELRKKFDENPRRYFAPLANEYRKAGDLDQAIFICQEYLPQQPGHMSGHIVYAQTLFEMGRHDEAKAVFETALSLDPENLIALRHLGDIARQTGDSNAARIWYQRVLEADPRNDEIAQIMISLLAEPAAGSRPSTPTPSTPVLARAVTPPTPAPSQPTTWDQPPHGDGFEIEKSVDKTQLAANTPPATVAQSPASAPTDAQQGGHEWLDLKDLTIGGVPMGTGTDEESERPDDPNADREPERSAEVLPRSFTDSFTDSMAEPFAEAFDEPEAPIESFTETPAESLTGSSARTPNDDDEGGFDLGHEDGAFEADPFAIAATSDKSRDSRYATSAPDTTHTVDIDDTPEAAAVISEDAIPEEVVAEQSVEDETPAEVDGLEQFEAGYMPSAAAAPPAPHIETASFFDAPPRPLGTPIFNKAIVESEAIESPARESSDVEPPGDESPEMDSYAIEGLETESSAIESSAVESAADEPIAEVPTDEVLTDDGPIADVPIAEVPIDDALTDELPTDELLTDEVLPVESTVAESAFAESTSAEPTRDEQPVNAADATAPVEEAFVTETMAELYLRQGHLESALDIYRKLVEQRPNDEELLVRLRAVETQVSAEPASEAEDEPAAANAYAGPTIREFLMGLTSWRGPELGEFDSTQATDADAMGEPPGDADSLPDVPSEEYPPAPLYSRRATPHMGKSVSGSIDALFSGADATAADASAATTLAEAFAPKAAPLQGVPAHRAANELSLDHVFKANTPPRSDVETDGFSFDQFFADDMSDPAPSPAGDAGTPSPEATDDIAQFNAWLNGLKKT